MADNHRVDAHGLDRLDGVTQRLALFDRGAGDRERQDVSGETLGRSLKGKAGAGRLFEEERGYHLAPQRRDLGHGPPLDFGEGLGHPEHLGDAGGPEVIDREEVVRGGHLVSNVPIHTPSSPTSTISSRLVGRFLPT